MLPSIFMEIFNGAFGLDQAIAGGIGAAIKFGIQRGLFATEAGMGSSPNAAATSDVSHPVKQGLSSRYRYVLLHLSKMLGMGRCYLSFFLFD